MTRCKGRAGLQHLSAGSSFVQLGIYNLSGWTKDGDSKGEQNAHYLEFAFGIISSLVTFWFVVDNKLLADARLAELMYDGPDLEVACVPCDDEEGPQVAKGRAGFFN